MFCTIKVQFIYEAIYLSLLYDTENYSERLRFYKKVFFDF